MHCVAQETVMKPAPVELLSHHRPARRRAWLLAAAAAMTLTAALAGCGSDGDSTPAPTPMPTPTPPPAGSNQPPVASFSSAAATIAAGTPLAFDGSASSDPDGDTLAHHWNFGDSTHGSSAKLAHIYTAAGSYTVTLTVSDGRGGTATTTQPVTVTAGPASAGTVNTLAVVTDSTGPLAGVVVSVAGGASATTAADGTATVATPLGVPVQIGFSKPGYADQMKALNLPAGATSGYVSAQLLVREPALTLPDAAAGGTLTGKHGARIVLPPNALVDAAGNAVTGPVQIAMTPVDVGTDTRNFPGLFQGITPAGEQQVLLSYGTVEYILTKDGAPVQLRPGMKATIDIPIYTGLHRDGSAVAAGQTTPLWSLDERTSQWIEEGAGTVVAAAGSPSDFALRAEVGHFSWWNCDVGENPYRPNGKCCIKDEPNGPCKENSGDVCEHYGTGPRGGPSSSNSLIATLQAAPQSSTTFPGRVSPMAEPQTVRIPATAAQATVPALAGGELVMPANMDITVVSSARNGTYRGTRVFRGAPGVREDVVVTLLPVASGGQDEPITLPWDKAYAMTAAAELDRYLLTMAAGPGFSVRVSQAASTLTGTVKLIRPDGTVVAQEGFAASPAVLNETQAVAGVYKIEVTASTGAPGGYRLEASSLGDCANVTAVTLPVNRVDPMPVRSNRCYDIAIPADQALQIKTERETNLNNASGTVTLSTGGGSQVLMVFQAFGGTFANPARPIIFGIGQAGTYRVRVANDSDSSGTMRFIVDPLPVTAALAVPGTATIDVPANSSGSQANVLLKPPADGRYFLQMDTTSFNGGANLYPRYSLITNHSARASQLTAPLLPVAVVFSNNNGGPATLTSGIPTTITRDVDISGNVGDTPVVYALDGVAGTEISKRLVRPAASPIIAVLDFFDPEGNVMGALNAVESMPATGVYTAYVRRISASGSTPYTLRVNTAPAPVPLTLTPPLTQISTDMPIGMVRRYTMDLAQAELVGLTLDTPALLAVATIDGVDNATASTSDDSTEPRSVASAPAYVRVGGSKMLRVYTATTDLESASGPLTIGVRKPVPAPATINAPIDVALAPGVFSAWRYDIPAEGYYLLRLTAPISPSGTATMWAPSTILSNYPGEVTVGAGLPSGGTPPEGTVKLTPGAYTLTLRAFMPPTVTAPVNFAASFVNLEAPTPLTLGAAPAAGSIDAIGERDYWSFAGTGGQAYTVRVTAAFNGILRVKKQLPNGDYVSQSLTFTVPGFPTPMVNGVEKAVSFTIPADAIFGNGTYVVDVDADDAFTGAYSVQMTTP